MITKESLAKLEGNNVGILYVSGFGIAKTATGYLKIEDDFLYLYDKDRSGSGYNFALHINGRRGLNKILQIEVLSEQYYQEVVVDNIKSFLLQKPNFIPNISQ